MRNLLTNYFYYSRREKNGVSVLAAMSLGILLLPTIFSILKTEPAKTTDLRAFEQAILAFQGNEATENTTNTEGVAAIAIEAELFAFNPNTASKEDLMRLGLSPKIANTIAHYREKGGRFFRNEDLKKIYGLKEEDYARLEEYIALENSPKSSWNNRFNTPQYQPVREVKLFPFDPNTATETELLTLGLDEKVVKNVLKYREKNGKFYKKEDLKRLYGFSEIDYLRLENYVQIVDNQRFTNTNPSLAGQNDAKKMEGRPIPSVIDINKASFEEWLEIRGIGRTFAARIIEQREKLGGFATLEQLKEVYGLPDTTYQNIIPSLKISTSVFRKILINKATIENCTHPYLTRKQMDVLVRYRTNHGFYKNMADLKLAGVLPDATLEKLKPYIQFD